MVKYFKKRPYHLILGVILLTGLFFRTFQIMERFTFAHDGDLYSWIVKDIVVNHHFRLIGQLTSAEGIFVGPLFYYLLIPFFLVSNMDPVGVTLLGVLIGVLTVISYYFVLSKLFNKTVGLVAAFLHAILTSTVDFDRWIVPTLPTKLWAIWYLYALIMTSRGNNFSFALLGILIGLIWHIHMVLLPALFAIPLSFLISRKFPNIKQILLFSISLIITSLPLIIFELRHNFLQTISLFNNFITPHEGSVGLPKLITVLEMIAKNVNFLFFEPQSLPQNFKLPFLFIILALPILFLKRKLLNLTEVTSLAGWFVGIILFFTFSSTLISEYYFTNLEIIFITIASLLFTHILKSSKIGLFFVIFIFGIVLFKNTIFFVELKPYPVGYIYRKAVADYITEDAKSKGFPCIGITYITMPGENVGFRYFFYLNNVHLIHPSNSVPVYNIVLPFHYSLNEVKKRFGVIGIIPPVKFPSKEDLDKVCENPNTNLTDSLFGYVE